MTGRILLKDATADDLASFSAVIESLHLEYRNGSLSKNMLPEPLRVELLGLEDVPLWLVSTEFPAGQLTAIVLELDPLSYEARADDGSAVSVTSLSDTLRAAVLCDPPPIVDDGIVAEPIETLMVDVDLLASLRGDVSSGSLLFEPRGTTLTIPAGETLHIEELDGLHVLGDRNALEVRVEGFTDDERTFPLGMVPIAISPGALLLDPAGNTLSSTQFFAALRPGLTVSEVHGLLPSRGRFRATRIEIEAQDRGVTDAFPVKIEGRIFEKLDLPSPRIQLQVREVERGEGIAVPVLAGLGDPPTIPILLTDPDLLVLYGNGFESPADLQVGQMVKVKFESFSSVPFVAARIDVLEPDARFVGELFSVSGLPATFVQHVDAGEPAVTSGQVQSAATDVTVDLTGGSEIVLDTVGYPPLSPDVLVDATTLRVNGEISGPASSPTVVARRVKVKAGLLDDAEVTGINAPNGINTVGGEVLGSFGKDVAPGGAHWIFFQPESVFHGAAKTRDQLFDLFSNLAPGERLMVTVKGIGLGGVMEINGYEIHSRVVP